MSTQKTILFFTFARFSTEKQIFHVSADSSQTESYKAEAQRVVGQIINIKLNPDERQKINSPHGNWYATVDNKEFGYLVLAAQDYPERYTYEMIKKVREQLEKIGDYQAEDDTTIKFNVKETMQELFKKYSDLKSFSALDKAQTQVKEVEVVMGKNIKSMLDNQNNLKRLDQKSASLSQASKTFEKQSKSLERIMYYRNLKLKIIIFLVFIAILAYVVVPIIISLTSSKDSNSNNNSTNNNNQQTQTNKLRNLQNPNPNDFLGLRTFNGY